MRDLTIIMAAWNNPVMCGIQTDYYASHVAKDIQERLQVIIVDDCSDLPPVVADPLPYRYSQYRILKHRRWDWLVCRNLGMKEAASEWRLMTDIDHIVPEDTLRYMMTCELDPKKAYRLTRKTLLSATDFTQLVDFKPHGDSWLMTGAAFDRVGRYFEDFSGLYGSSGEFTGRVEAKLGKAIQLPVPLWRVPRETVPDASTPREIDGKSTRKTPEDRVGMINARRKLATSKKPPMYLSVPWEKVR